MTCSQVHLSLRKWCYTPHIFFQHFSVSAWVWAESTQWTVQWSASVYSSSLLYIFSQMPNVWQYPVPQVQKNLLHFLSSLSSYRKNCSQQGLWTAFSKCCTTHSTYCFLPCYAYKRHVYSWNIPNWATHTKSRSRWINCKAAKRSNSLCIFGVNYNRYAGFHLYKGRISLCVWNEPTSPLWQHVSLSSEPARGPGSAAAACPWPHDAASSAAPVHALLLVAPYFYCTAWTQTGRKTSLDTCRLTCQHREAVSNIYSYFSSNTLRSCSLFSRQLCLSFSSASREVAWAFRASHSLAS